MAKYTQIFVVGLFAVFACDPAEPVDFKGPVEGFRPVYSSPEMTEISWQNTQLVEQPGKIYLYQHFLFINEAGKGVHVYDNSDPASPNSIGFIRIAGNSDIAIRDGVLYANYLNNIVSIRLNNFHNLQKESAIELNSWDMGVPPPVGFYFECIDESKGVVTEWRSTQITNPDCYALSR